MNQIDQLKQIILTIVPEAQEAVVYGVSGFKYKNKNLAGFAVTTNHLGYYPMSPKLIVKYAEELKDFETAKGTIRFPLDRMLPTAVIEKIVKDRKNEIDEQVKK